MSSNLIVIDNFLNLEEIQLVDNHLNNKPWGFVDDLGEAFGRYRSIGHSKEINSLQDFDEFECFLYEKISYVVDNLSFLPKNYDIFRIYYNAIRYGDKFNYHQDGNGPTFLIYGNKAWKKSWKSHTLFRDGSLKKKVLPKPGRIIIFDGQLEHRASAPTSHFEENARFSVVFQTNLV
jgi:hypothetical protein